MSDLLHAQINPKIIANIMCPWALSAVKAIHMGIGIQKKLGSKKLYWEIINAPQDQNCKGSNKIYEQDNCRVKSEPHKIIKMAVHDDLGFLDAKVLLQRVNEAEKG